MSAESLKAKSFSVALTANDVERSLKFYTEALGFEVEHRIEPNGKFIGAMLTAGEGRIALSQDDFAKGRAREKGIGIGLYFDTDQDLESLANRVKSAGVSFEKELSPLPWGPMAFIVRDPDGFKITVKKPG